MHIAKPINQLVSGENASRKKNLMEWTAEHLQAFEHLNQLGSQTPVLAYVNYRRSIKLHTDASEKELGDCSLSETGCMVLTI